MTAVGLYDSNTLSGALDLGGASEQITFVPQTSPLEGGVSLRLYGQNYSIYTHSYLCYGRNEANRQLLARLVQVGCSRLGDVGKCEFLVLFVIPGFKLFHIGNKSMCTERIPSKRFFN